MSGLKVKDGFGVKKPSGKSLSVIFPKSINDKMERMLESGEYSTYSEIIREAVRRFLEESKVEESKVEESG